MGRRKRYRLRPSDLETDWWGAGSRGEEIPLIEAQDPGVLDQQEGPVGAAVPTPDPRDPRLPGPPPSPDL